MCNGTSVTPDLPENNFFLLGAGEMADWLEVFAALAEDPDSDSSTALWSSQLPGSHSKQCLCLTPSFGLLGALHLHMHKMKSL